MKKVALACGLVGAGMLALNMGLTLPAYCTMLFSSALFIVAFHKTEKEVVLLNAGYASLNVLGLVTSL